MQGVAQSHDHPADDLAVDAQGVQALAHVMGRRDTTDPDDAGFLVDLRLHGLGRVFPPRHVLLALGLVGERGVVALAAVGAPAQDRPFVGVGPFEDFAKREREFRMSGRHDALLRHREIVLGNLHHPGSHFQELFSRVLRGDLHRHAGVEGHPARERAAVVGRGARVRAGDAHRLHRKPQHLGGDLAHDHGHALADFGGAHQHLRAAVLVELDVGAGDARMGGGGLGDDREAPAHVGGLGLVPADLLGHPFQALPEADALHHVVDGVDVAFLEDVLEPQLQRIHAQALGDHVQLRLDGEGALGHPQPAQLGAAHLVGVDEGGRNPEVVNAVGAVAVLHGAVAGGQALGVGAGVPEKVDVPGR